MFYTAIMFAHLIYMLFSCTVQSLAETETHNQVQYWMCCVVNSIREVVSPDPVDDNLTEKYCHFDEDSVFQVGLNDLLFSDFSQLAEFSATEHGLKAFHALLLQMPQFVILLRSFLSLSFTSMCAFVCIYNWILNFKV